MLWKIAVELSDMTGTPALRVSANLIHSPSYQPRVSANLIHQSNLQTMSLSTNLGHQPSLLDQTCLITDQ